MQGVKMQLSSQATFSLTQAYKNLFPDTTSASVPAVTRFISSLSMYVFFVYNTFFLTACCVKAYRRLLSE
jgi:membrane-bound acyltransferase YfiQ involved in biofilm formation